MSTSLNSKIYVCWRKAIRVAWPKACSQTVCQSFWGFHSWQDSVRVFISACTEIWHRPWNLVYTCCLALASGLGRFICWMPPLCYFWQPWTCVESCGLLSYDGTLNQFNSNTNYAICFDSEDLNICLLFLSLLKIYIFKI